MNASDVLLDQWTRQVKEVFPQLHSYQQHAIAFGVQGIVQSGNAVMQKVAETAWEHLSSETKMTSHERRLHRLVANSHLDVDVCWKTFLHHVLPLWQNQSVILVLDLTPYTTEATIVYVGIVVQSRVLPLAWQVMPQQETWEEGQWDIVARLFAQIAPLLSSATCTLIADRGLTCLNLIKLCQQVKWHYVLRIKQEEWFRRTLRRVSRPWQQGKELIKHEGDQWYGEIVLWKEHAFSTCLSACWEPGYEEAWLLISDQPASHKRVRQYGKRMRVEATFQDQKSRGCMIECSRFIHREHLHRWLFLYFWRCGGWRIWATVVCIMANASKWIAPIDATKDGYGLVACGSKPFSRKPIGIYVRKPAVESRLNWPIVCRFFIATTVCVSLCISNEGLTFLEQSFCRGERGPGACQRCV